MSHPWVNLAKDAIRQKHPGRARRLLREYLRHHRDDEEALILYEELDYLSFEPSQSSEWTAPRPAEPLPIPTCAPEYLSRESQYSAQPSTSHRHVSLGGQFARWTLKLSLLFFAVLFFAVVAIAMLPVFWGNRTLVIASGSMEPTIPVGSAVIAEPVPSADLQVGDVIAVTPNPNDPLPIVHRIVNMEVRKGTRYYTTQGDANDVPDRTEFGLPPTAWRVHHAIPLVGYIIAFASSTAGIALFLVLPGLSLLFLALLDGLQKISRALQPWGQRVYQ